MVGTRTRRKDGRLSKNIVQLLIDIKNNKFTTMLAPTLLYRPQSFYDAELATTVSATATQIAVSVVPIETRGILVIDRNTPKEEIILYASIVGNTLMGCVRGLAKSGSSLAPGIGVPHGYGASIGMAVPHYYDSLFQLAFNTHEANLAHSYRGWVPDSTFFSGIVTPENGDRVLTLDTLLDYEYSGVIQYNTLVGIFTVAETVTGGTSGATGVIVSNGGGQMIVKLVTGTFQVAETITGGTSGATAHTLTIPQWQTIAAPVNAVNATFVAKGVAQVATQLEVNAGTAIGTTGASLFVRPDMLPGAITAFSGITLPAYEDVVAGDPLKFVLDGGLKKLAKVHGIANSGAGITGLITDGIALSATEMVICSTDGDPFSQVTWYVTPVSYIAGVFTVGASVIVSTINRGSSPRDDWGCMQIGADTGFPDMTIYRMSDTAFIVGGWRLLQTGIGSNDPTTAFFVGTVAANVITLGAYQDLGFVLAPGDSYEFYGFASTSTDHGVFLHDNNGASVNAKYISVNEGAHTITIIDNQTIGWNNGSRIHQLGTDRFLLNSIAGGSYRVATITGAVIVFVTGVNAGFPIATSKLRSRTISQNLDSTGIIVIGQTNSFDLYNFSESVGILTLGAVQSITATGLLNVDIESYDKEGNILLVEFFLAALDFKYMKLYAGPTTVTPVTSTTYDMQYTYGAINSSTGLPKKGWVYIAKQTGLLVTKSNSTAKVSFDWDDYMGCANATTLAGANLTMDNIGKTNTSQTAMLINAVQYILWSGKISAQSAVALNGKTFTSITKAGYSESATALYVMNEI